MDLEQLQGLISGIERFALHDGPGIRTLVFMKGCPLRCLWCSSPQTQKRSPEILYDTTTCQKCGECIGACPAEAMMMSEEEGIRIDREACTGCGECVEVCPNNALESVGAPVTVDELFEEVKKDSSFYRRSGGGVTMGGGEPTMQHDVAAGLLEKCHRHYIHTAMETCGYVEWQHLEKLLAHLDLVYLDIKHMDTLKHKDHTGVSNELILENAGKISALRSTIIRIPIVPGYNDSDDNIVLTAAFAAKLGENLKGIELLPYHQLGVQTYAELGREYRLIGLEPPGNDHMKRLKKIIESCGVAVHIGG